MGCKLWAALCSVKVIVLWVCVFIEKFLARFYFWWSFWYFHLRNQRLIDIVLVFEICIVVLHSVRLLCFMAGSWLTWTTSSLTKVDFGERCQTFRWFNGHLASSYKTMSAWDKVKINRVVSIGRYFFTIYVFLIIICDVSEGDIECCFFEATISFFALKIAGCFVLILHESLLIL